MAEKEPGSSWSASMSAEYLVNWWPFLLAALLAVVLRLRSSALVLTPVVVATLV